MGDPVIQRPGEGERLDLGGGSTVILKAGGDDTGGSLYVGETTIEPGFAGPPPHRHERLHDMFYVLEGRLTVRVEDEILELGPGSFVCAPPGVVHSFSNPTHAPVRFLNFNTPAGWELYVRDLAEAAKSGPLTPDVVGRIASRYDFQRV